MAITDKAWEEFAMMVATKGVSKIFSIIYKMGEYGLHSLTDYDIEYLDMAKIAYKDKNNILRAVQEIALDYYNMIIEMDETMCDKTVLDEAKNYTFELLTRTKNVNGEEYLMNHALFLLLEKLGINKHNNDGKERLLIDVLDEYQLKWDQMTSEEKHNLGFHPSAVAFFEDIVEKYRIVQDKVNEHKNTSRIELNNRVIEAFDRMAKGI